MSKPSFDSKCLDLARHFYPEATDDDLRALAVSFQGVAEDFPLTLQVTCARCGAHGTSMTFMVEEGDEWECPPCWERCEAQERGKNHGAR